VKYEFKPSFDRSIKALPEEEKADIKNICFIFIDLLELHAKLPSGIGLKHLANNFWEIRRGLRSRILFRWVKDSIEFVLAGDHNSIKKYLKDI